MDVGDLAARCRLVAITEKGLYSWIFQMAGRTTEKNVEGLCSHPGRTSYRRRKKIDAQIPRNKDDSAHADKKRHKTKKVTIESIVFFPGRDTNYREETNNAGDE